MARLSYPRHAGAAPQALPPAERTVGQVVAESIKLEGASFFPSLAAGVVAFAPALAARVVVFPGIYLLALVWLAATIFTAPAILVEGVPLRESFGRSLRLMRADAVHAVGALATLTIVIVVTALVLTFLLRGFGDQGIRIAALIALLVLTPLFFLGSAVLYADQAARVRVEPHD